MMVLSLPKHLSFPVVVQAVERHLKNLIRLSQTIPCSEILLVYLCKTSNSIHLHCVRQPANHHISFFQQQKKVHVTWPCTYSMSVGLYCSISVLQFHVLMAHQCPGRQVLGVKSQSSLEVQHRLLMLTTQAVVVTCREDNRQDYIFFCELIVSV